MTIKESLKKIYKAFSGGTESNSRSISGILNDISTVASGGGGGTNLFEITITQPEWDESIGGVLATTTVTPRQIKSAMDNGYIPYVKYSYDITVTQDEQTIRIASTATAFGALIASQNDNNYIVIGGEMIEATFESWDDFVTLNIM